MVMNITFPPGHQSRRMRNPQGFGDFRLDISPGGGEEHHQMFFDLRQDLSPKDSMNLKGSPAICDWTSVQEEEKNIIRCSSICDWTSLGLTNR
jgi:hypothetical protein